MQPSSQKLRISQSNIEIDDILSDLQQHEPIQTQIKNEVPTIETQKQVSKPQTALATKRAAHKETKEQTGLKVQGSKIAGVPSSGGAPKNKENTDAINSKEQKSISGSESKSAHTTATKASTAYQTQTTQKQTVQVEMTPSLTEFD